jgi:hypothetical protein
MTPDRLSVPPISAPGIESPVVVPTKPGTGPRSSRRKRNRSYSHVHLEIDLGPLPEATPRPPAPEDPGISVAPPSDGTPVDLAQLIGGTLHALAARRFRRIDHWEVSPGGWLPPPVGTRHEDDEEPVGPLLKALEGGSWGSLEKVRSFSARMSDLSGSRIDVTVRRVGRLHRHALSLDLWGLWTPSAVDDLTGSLASRLPVVQSEMTKFQYA